MLSTFNIYLNKNIFYISRQFTDIVCSCSSYFKEIFHLMLQILRIMLIDSHENETHYRDWAGQLKHANYRNSFSPLRALDLTTIQHWRLIGGC